MERPSAAKLFRVGWENTERFGCINGSPEKPSCAEKTAKLRAWSPIAIAGAGTFDSGEVMIPNGILAREKCDFGDMGSQDFNTIFFDFHLV